jgi:hypothetical protein
VQVKPPALSALADAVARYETTGETLAGLLPGGPPPDGIPAIDRPVVAPIRDSVYPDREPVVGVVVGGEARAYPLRIMVWHEIVNDEIGGHSVAVTYCPLCNTTLAFERVVAGAVVTFGVSGFLHGGALVMFDRETGSLWSQVSGEALHGVRAGIRLAEVPVQFTSIAQWRTAHPDATILTEDTGFERPYGDTPYPGYDDRTEPWIFEGETDERFPPMTRVVGLGQGAEARALLRDEIAAAGAASLLVGTDELVVVHWPGVPSVLDARAIDDAADIGSITVFRGTVSDQALDLTLDRDGGLLVDRKSGSRWTVLGTGVDGPLAAHDLEPVRFHDTFWFAWAAYQPATTVIRVPAPG